MMWRNLAIGSLQGAALEHDNHIFQKDAFSFRVAQDIRLPKPLSDFTASLNLSDGLVYIAGGCDAELGNVFNEEFQEFVCTSTSDQLIVFDQATGTFDTTLPNMPVKRYRHGAALVNDQLWLFGGRDSEADALLPTMDVYNIRDRSWKSYTVDEAHWRSDNGGFADPDSGIAYFVGGYDPIYNFKGTVTAIDTVTTTNTGTLTMKEGIPDMILARGDLSAAAGIDGGYAIVTGGFGGDSGFCEPLRSVERFDFASQEWREIASINAARGDKALVAFRDHFFAMGGERQIIGICDLSPEDEPAVGEKTVAVDDFEVYHPENDTWETLLEDLPYHNFRFAAIGLDSSGAIYTFGGQKAYDDSCKCFRVTDEIIIFADHDNLDVAVVPTADDASSSSVLIPTWGMVSLLAVAVARLTI